MVFLGENSEGTLILKVIRKDKKFTKEQEIKLINREADILSSLGSHPNFTRLIDYNPEGKYFNDTGCTEVAYLALEHGENDTMMRYLSPALGALDREVSRFYCMQLGAAVFHMHSLNIAHLDIKPTNILLDKFFNLKLADFGCSLKTRSTEEVVNQRMGTKYYIAPEVSDRKSGEGYNPFKADIYSLGVTLHFIITGHLPDKQILEESTCESVASQSESEIFGKDIRDFGRTDDMDTDSDSDFEIDSDEYMMGMIKEMIDPDPEVRPSIDEVLDNPWLGSDLGVELPIFVFNEMSERKCSLSLNN